MTRIAGLAVFAAITLSAQPIYAHPHDGPKSAMVLAVEKEVLAVREVIKASIAARDAAKLKTLYASDYTHTHGSGRMDGRDARIVSALAGEPLIETASVEELHVHVHGAATAIVTGKSPILNKAEDRSYEFRWMQVYVNTGKGWQLAASQATRMPPPPTQ